MPGAARPVLRLAGPTPKSTLMRGCACGDAASARKAATAPHRRECVRLVDIAVVRFIGLDKGSIKVKLRFSLRKTSVPREVSWPTNYHKRRWGVSEKL